MNKVYQIITERICHLLEQGEIPWMHPWKTPGIFPQNMISKREYTGINSFLLTWGGFQIPYFLTFKQVKKLGGFVKKGEHGFPVIFWKFIEVGKNDKGSVESSTDTVPLLRYYTVFHVSQVEGIQDKIPPLEKPNEQHTPIEKAEHIIANMPNPPKIQHVKRQAYYDHQNDIINVPPPEWFESTEHYYATIFHELIHCTGHHTRLARRPKDEKRKFGDEKYSKEELIAEMGSAFLCAICGISKKPTLENAAAYIQSWLEVFKNDKTILISAAGKAQKAVDYILRVKEN